MDTIELRKLRKPNLRDKIAVRHGRYIHGDCDNRKIVRFVRDEIGMLVDFLAELFKKEGHKLIGIRGMPRVGKTESIVAGSVSANKRWLIISCTILKQTIRNELTNGEYSHHNIYTIDGGASHPRTNEQHWQLIREIMQRPATKVTEHTDCLADATQYDLDD